MFYITIFFFFFSIFSALFLTFFLHILVGILYHTFKNIKKNILITWCVFTSFKSDFSLLNIYYIISLLFFLLILMSSLVSLNYFQVCLSFYFPKVLTPATETFCISFSNKSFDFILSIHLPWNQEREKHFFYFWITLRHCLIDHSTLIKNINFECRP